MSSHLKIVSLNVKGLNHPAKRKKVRTYLKLINTDIAFLQETHLRSSDNSRFLAGWAGQHFHFTFQAKARGVSILVAKNILFEPTKTIPDNNGRFIILVGNVALVNVYFPRTLSAFLIAFFPIFLTWALTV